MTLFSVEYSSAIDVLVDVYSSVEAYGTYFLWFDNYHNKCI